jgi:hypothetical protein
MSGVTRRITSRLFVPLLLALGARAAHYSVVAAPAASPLEKFAAAELARYLGGLYPDDTFSAGGGARGAQLIRVGTPRSLPPRSVRAADLRTPESFVVAPGLVAGADPRGALFGVYALLENLGCGFYLSYETVTPRREPFSFSAWHLKDAPLYRDRFVFNWHNFLSSASSWELDDWRHYIDQAAKMRFNAIMVHAYGNNPMFQFRYRGEVKPVGYLATTRAGRDWGTQHVNDVRRLAGGEVFSGPVFGASVARVEESRRAAAATQLMQSVFAHARSRGLGVTFALDVDTLSANPQNIIRTLPAEARFRGGDTELANPDTPEGYACFKAQLEQLFATYPQIDRLAIWFRNNRTPWTELKHSELPASWRDGLQAILARNPAVRDLPQAPGYYAVGRLIAAAARALKELNLTGVELATGNWRLSTIPQWDPFIPRGVTYLPLDWNTVFETAAGQRDLRGVAPDRKLAPVVWAHHDDRTYIGRPYAPFVAFSSLLAHSRAAGFGIIHWTTRPLDFYFKSLSRQVWSATRDEGPDDAARRMAADSFGAAAAESGVEYLFRFVTEAPMFGRETSDRFMDIPLGEPALHIRRILERLELLERLSSRTLTAAARERLEFHRGYERFMLGFFESHTAWERARDAQRRNDLETARRELARSRPEEVIQAYAAAARRVRISKGEQALMVSLNLRWLPYVLSLRQALGLEPARIKFGPTQHEPLAQGAGSNTFHADADGRLWKTLGEKETGAPAYQWSEAQAAGEMARTGLRVARPLALKLGPIMGDALAPGRYRVELLLARGPEAGAVEVAAGPLQTATEIPAGPGDPLRVVLDLGAITAAPEIRVRPTRGDGWLAAATLLPVR